MRLDTPPLISVGCGECDSWTVGHIANSTVVVHRTVFKVNVKVLFVCLFVKGTRPRGRNSAPHPACSSAVTAQAFLHTTIYNPGASAASAHQPVSRVEFPPL